MKSRGFTVVALLMLVSMLFAPMSMVTVKADVTTKAAQPVKHSLAESDTGIYIVRLQDASLSAYQGGVAGLRATSPEATGAHRLDTSSVVSQAYLTYLSGKQGELLSDMATAYRHPVEVVYQYKNVLNAVAVRITHAEALQAFNLPGVLTVYPDQIHELQTDEGPELIGAPVIWNGETPDGASTYGEGMIIGIIDTGINHAHPSFANPAAKDGYVYTNPYGEGNYVGVCATDPLYADFCNGKIIGAYDLIDSTGAEDTIGHGSHTSSIAAGNFVDVIIDDGDGGTFTVPIQGVAPHANLISYRVCDDQGCYTSGTVAAVDHAIEDMVNVLNYSIGPTSGTTDPWGSADQIAFLEASTAGIFVSESAGNNGPTAGTVGHNSPWAAVVGGTTISRILAHLVDVTATAGSLTDLGALEGTGPVITEDITAPILFGGDVDPANFEGCTAWTGTPFEGKIGLVQRGTCNFSVKVDNLAAAGAVAALVFNNIQGPPIIMGALETTTIPSMMLDLADGQAVVALISGDLTATATIPVAKSFAYKDEWEDFMYSSSSRGPSQWELLKPDYAAPAENILAAVAAVGDDPVQFEFYSGTSMASPHSAGSGALLMKLHPEWTPAMIRSALATTAIQDITDNTGLPADPFDIGSGRIDLAKAVYAGFVLDETATNYVAADPELGGDPNTLNQPHLVDYTCVGTCTWTRTIKSTLGVAQDWAISFESDAGIELSATPMTFTLAADGTQTIEITADVSAAAPATYYFGDVILTPVGNEEVSTAHLTTAVMLGVSNLPSQLDILTSQLAGTVTLTDLQATIAIEDLWIEIGGLTLGVPHDIELLEDPTPGDPFDDLSQVFWTTIAVPRETLRLVVEIVASEAPDVDLFVGSGDTPSIDTLLAYSASGIWDEYCNIDLPARGTYWIVVQNWEGSDDQPDAIRAITAVVVEDAGNLTVTGPETVPALEPFELDVNWDEPSMVDGDYWYAQFSVGTSRKGAGNLGYTNVDLEFFEPFYDIDLTPAIDAKEDGAGKVVTYTLTLSNLGNVEDTITVAAEGNTWEVNLPVTSFVVPAGDTAEVIVGVTIPTDAVAEDFDVVTITATSEGGDEASSVLTTTVIDLEYYYLPIIWKNIAVP